MERQPKEKKSLQNEGDPDTVDSLVVALASEILAPENLNFLLPITAFTVPFPIFIELTLGCCGIPVK
jgi:hypothetical protein